MKATRLLVVALCLSLAIACGDHTPTAAPQPPQADLIGSLVGATGLLKCSSVPFAQDVETIGSGGGVLSAGGHTLVIPAGALSVPTKITMTVPTGLSVNAVEFEPEGLQFARPASLTMSYANCNLLGKLLPKRIAYTDDNLNILTYLLSIDNLLAKRVTGQVNHFSDYVVAW
jgi:hypothetical protein